MLLEDASAFDPGNIHAVPYLWGTVAIGYNVAKIGKRMPQAPVTSLDMIFKAAVAKRFSGCGIAVVDAPDEILQLALRYLGKDPYSAKSEDYKAAENLLLKARPYIKYFHSSRYIDDLAKGNICLALGRSSDLLAARNRATAAKKGAVIDYHLPAEGTRLWMDTLAIPAGASNPQNAHRFIDFLLRADIAAEASNYIGAANVVMLSTSMVDGVLRGNTAIYPSTEVIARSFGDRVTTPALERLRSRTWARIRAGQ